MSGKGWSLVGKGWSEGKERENSVRAYGREGRREKVKMRKGKWM